MIDHIVANAGLKGTCVVDSSSVLYANNWISGFSNNTSDHYPVYSKFKDEQKPTNTVRILNENQGFIYRDISGRWFLNKDDISDCNVSVYMVDGREVYSGKLEQFNNRQANQVLLIRILYNIYRVVEI